MDKSQDNSPDFNDEDASEINDDESVPQLMLYKVGSDSYNYGQVIKGNPLINNKGSPQKIELHKKELQELFEALYKAKEKMHYKDFEETKHLTQLTTKDQYKSDHFQFGNDYMNDTLEPKDKRFLRKATLMPQYKEIELDFVVDDIETLQKSQMQRCESLKKGKGVFDQQNIRLHECERMVKRNEIISPIESKDNSVNSKSNSEEEESKIKPAQRQPVKRESDNLFLIQHSRSKIKNMEEENKEKNNNNNNLFPIKEQHNHLAVKSNLVDISKRRQSVNSKKTNLQPRKSKSRRRNASKNKPKNAAQTTLNVREQSDLIQLNLALKKCPLSTNQIDPFEQGSLEIRKESSNLVNVQQRPLIDANHRVVSYDDKVELQKRKSLFERANKKQPYNEILLTDTKFREFYSQSLYEAIFTFPKFQRTYSKNYKNVQMSFRKVSKKKKTIVFDIDETLVLATTNKNELKQIDDTIFIKMTRFGGQAKAFLSFRPYLHEMLDELSKDFELILYTCGTASYAQCFAEAVQKKRKYFNHILNLQHCLYSIENDMFIKDLKILEEGRTLNDIVIVDNNIQSFFLQLSNGIPIYDYTGDKNDEVLLSLTEYLKTFLDVVDVRQKIDKDFSIKELLEEKADMYMNYQQREW